MEHLSFGAYLIDTRRRRLLHDGIPVDLSPATVGLIEYLAQRDGRVVSHRELANVLWERDAVAANTIAQHVHLARAALRDLRKPHVYIETVPRRGYRFAR